MANWLFVVISDAVVALQSFGRVMLSHESGPESGLLNAIDSWITGQPQIFQSSGIMDDAETCAYVGRHIIAFVIRPETWSKKASEHYTTNWRNQSKISMT